METEYQLRDIKTNTLYLSCFTITEAEQQQEILNGEIPVYVLVKFKGGF